jgi:hypothetical protein
MFCPDFLYGYMLQPTPTLTVSSTSAGSGRLYDGIILMRHGTEGWLHHCSLREAAGAPEVLPNCWRKVLGRSDVAW